MSDSCSKDQAKPLVISLCGTFLKPEMQSIYRQVTGLRRLRTAVFTQSLENPEMFPFPKVVTLQKQKRPRPRGNFILRFWFKHVLKVWPPPRPIHRPALPHEPYNLVKQLKHFQPDLVHVYYGHKAVHYLEMLQSWGGPYVVSFHGVDVSKFLDRKGYKEKLQTVFKEAKLVMGRSESLLKRLKELGCPEHKLRLNRTPVPLTHLEADLRTPPLDDQWRLVQACRLIPKKGILTLLDALAQVRLVHPKLRYILCGDGPMRSKILHYASDRGLLQNIELRGWLDQATLMEEYRKAHLFLHPSETTKEADQEGIPNSMLEAMATGLPVVATRHGGIPEAVTHGHDGLLAPERSADELARLLLRVMSDPEELKRLSANAAASVRANFGSEAQVAALEDIYLEAISPK
jgi:colanic acid/amylovoran biosynthesis glycosyltransferase